MPPNPLKGKLKRQSQNKHRSFTNFYLFLFNCLYKTYKALISPPSGGFRGLLIQVVIATGFHLFPFRTEKLSLSTSMVLQFCGRVDSRRFLKASCNVMLYEAFFVPGSLLRTRQYDI